MKQVVIAMFAMRNDVIMVEPTVSVTIVIQLEYYSYAVCITDPIEMIGISELKLYADFLI